MYKDKEVKVILSEEANNVYDELNKIVGDEIKKRIDSSFHQTLLRSIKRVIETLRDNPFAGDQVRRILMPRKYIIKYDVKNVWRIELANRWRLLYTITSENVEIINFVLDIVDHKKYDKIFGYKKH